MSYMKRENVSFVLKIASVAQASHKLAFLLLAECWDFSCGPIIAGSYMPSVSSIGFDLCGYFARLRRPKEKDNWKAAQHSEYSGLESQISAYV